ACNSIVAVELDLTGRKPIQWCTIESYVLRADEWLAVRLFRMLNFQHVAIVSAALHIQLEPLHIPGVPPGPGAREKLTCGKAQNDEVAQPSQDIEHTCLATAVLAQQEAQVTGPELEVHQRPEVVGDNPFQHRQ